MRALLIALTLLAPVPAFAQDGCPAGAEPIPAALAGWGEGAPVAAGAASEGAMEIALGETFAAELHPNAHLALVVPTRRPPGADSHGGFLDFEVPSDGTYRIALSDPAWIEVIQGTAPVASSTHGHGPKCSGMRKIVDFPLKAGRHVVQISGAPAASVRVLVVRGG